MHRRSLFLGLILICLFSSILFSQSIAYKAAFKIESNPKEGFYWPYLVFLPDSEMVKGKSINLSEIKKVKMYFFLGDKDNNDSVPYSDSYDDQDRQLIMKYFGPSLQKRWKVCDSLYHSVKLNNAKFVMYPNAEHKITIEMKSDLLKFYSEAIKE